jgi:D-alanine-D-alanine ligase
VAVASMAGIHVAKSFHLFKHTQVNLQEIAAQLKFPVFVKPNNGGSSIGMSKVYEPGLLRDALEKAYKEDDQVLVEEMITGREFTVGVFKTKENIIALPITEVISKKDFFDYEAKYEGASTEITPAEIDSVKTDKIKEAAKKIYSVLNCRGVVRIDFIFNEEKGEPFMLEINTIPGQSDASIVPQQVKVMGWSLKEFYSKLLEECF